MPTMSHPHARRRTAQRDPDDILIDELRAPVPLEDAREALDFWVRRRDSLAWTRRRARRDAAEMVARWQQRVRDAERYEQAQRPWRRLLDALGIEWPPASLRLPTRRQVTLVIGGSIAALGAFLLAMTLVFLVVAYAVLSHL